MSWNVLIGIKRQTIYIYEYMEKIEYVLFISASTFFLLHDRISNKLSFTDAYVFLGLH